MSTPAFVIGNITRDLQPGHTSDGTPVVNLSLADTTTTFWEVVVFGPQAEHITATLVRGARAIAVGTFRTRTWVGDDGQQRSRLEVVADQVGPSLRWATAQVTKTATKS